MRTKNLIIIGAVCIAMCVLAVVYLWQKKYIFEPFTIQSTLRVKKPVISGTMYYVSTSGNNSFDGRATDRAFSTIQKAFDVMQPGDGVTILDGRYEQDFATMRNGTKEKPIVVMGSRDAIVQGTGKKARIFEINHDYITVYGFTIDGLVSDGSRPQHYRDKLIYIEGKDLQDGVEGTKVLSMDLKNAGGECVRIKYFSHNNEIAYNTITGCGAYDFIFDGGGKNGEGIYIGTAPEQVEKDKNVSRDPDQSDRNWVHDNKIDTQGNECVDVKEDSSFNVIEHNVCTGQKDKESAGLDSRGNENIFRYNEVFGCVGAGVRLGGDEDDDGIKNDVIENRIHNNKSGGIKIEAMPQGVICGNEITDNGKDDIVGEYGDDVKNQKKCQ